LPLVCMGLLVSHDGRIPSSVSEQSPCQDRVNTRFLIFQLLARLKLQLEVLELPFCPLGVPTGATSILPSPAKPWVDRRRESRPAGEEVPTKPGYPETNLNLPPVHRPCKFVVSPSPSRPQSARTAGTSYDLSPFLLAQMNTDSVLSFTHLRLAMEASGMPRREAPAACLGCASYSRPFHYASPVTGADCP